MKRRVPILLVIFATVNIAKAQQSGAPLKPTAAVSRTADVHRVTSRQLDEIRRVDTERQDQQIDATEFSMPITSRGRSVDTSELLRDLWTKMSRRDRRYHFGHSKAAVAGQELDEILKKSQDVVIHELEVTETNPEAMVIDVDGDGKLDRIDAIRYSVPGAPNRRLCGPTIAFERNQKLIVNLKNKLKVNRQPILDWNPGCEPPAPPEPPAFWMMDAPHDLFSTNLHMHGLHISSGGGHDNVFLEAESTATDAANELFLDYELPRNHVAGTFWYHAHNHGSVAYQLANGMAGALIVLGDPSPNSGDLESIPEIQAANQIKHRTDRTRDVEYGRVFLLQQLVLTKTTVKDPDGVSRDRWIVDPADVNDRKSAASEKNVGRITEGIPPNKPDSAEVLAVNGHNAPMIEIQRGRIERWRLIHAGRESALNLAWYKASDLMDTSITVPEMSDVIETYEIATDGIPTGRLRYSIATELYPGYRSDILVKVTDQAVDGEYWLLPSESQRLTRTQFGPVKNATPVAKLVVKGQLPKAMQLPKASQLERLKRPAPDITDAKTMDLFFTFADKLRFGVATVVNRAGKSYAESGSAEAIQIELDTPQVWKLGVREFLPGVSEIVKHPFHIHVNPFYVPSLGVWKDTIAISRDETTEIQFIPTDFAGRSVLHCHILDHEDQGMMKDINLVGTSRGQYPDLYQIERLSTEERVKVPGLNLVPGKHNVLVFITGAGCPHCVEGLVKLWKRSEPLKEMDATVQCMSALPIAQNDLATLGLKKKDHFQFGKAPDGFKLSKYSGQTSSQATTSNGKMISHGVLIFDKNQNLRYRFLSDRPLGDLDEITYALMELKDPAESTQGRFHRVSHLK